MKTLKLILGTLVLAGGLSSCSSAYFASASYASDDLYAVHDRKQIALRKQAEAEAQRAEAEARKAEWEALIAEAEAAAAENKYYEYNADVNPYDAVLADDYESAYARRLRGFESPTYKMPSSYLNARYSSTFNYVSAYDPAFYNIVISGDQIWVEPKYITSMFGTWGGTVICADPWYYGWSYPWSYGLSFGSWGWSFGWNSWYNPWYYDPWGPWYSSWYRPWWGWNWGWAYGPGWRPGWHGHPHWSGPGYARPRYGSLVRRPDPYRSPSGTRYGVGSTRYGNAPSSASPSRGNSNRRNYFGIRDNNSFYNNSGTTSRSYRDNGNSWNNNRNNSGSNSYNRGNSGSSFNRGSSGSSFGGSGGGSGTRPSGGSSRNAGGR